MASTRSPLPRDPEFHPLGGPRRPPDVPDPAPYLRLVANPFLALLGLMAIVVVFYQLLVKGEAGPYSYALVFPVALAGANLHRLLHYHCLDCGGTGPLLRWKEHLCARSAERMEFGGARWWRGPRPIFQVVLWLYALLAAAIVGGAFWL